MENFETELFMLRTVFHLTLFWHLKIAFLFKITKINAYNMRIFNLNNIKTFRNMCSYEQ